MTQLSHRGPWQPSVNTFRAPSASITARWRALWSRRGLSFSVLNLCVVSLFASIPLSCKPDPEPPTATPTVTPCLSPSPTGPADTATPTFPPSLPTALVINEVDCLGTDWIELFNPTSLDQLLTGWVLTDDPTDPTRAYTFPSRTRLAPGDFLVVKSATTSTPGLPFGIACADDTLYLLDAEGAVRDAVSPPAPVESSTWGRIPDGLGACEATTATQGFDNVPYGTSPTGWLYDPYAVPIVDITLDPAAWLDMTYNQFEYTEGLFRLIRDGVPGPTYTVGVRLKGYVGSYQTIDGKPSFKIKFDFVEPDQRYYGMKKLTFNNLIQDGSMIHETLAYDLMRAANVPSPRTGYTWIRVNGLDYGLYANVEVPDDVMLDTWFDSTQHLYEGAYGVDVVPGAEYSYEVDEGDSADVSDLTALIEAANSPDDEWLSRMESLTDLDEMLRMWAVELYIGHWDGYPTRNNYFLHSDDTGRFVMEPWGTDQTFGVELSFVGSQGLMFTRCLGIPACKQRYLDTVKNLRSVVDTLALQDDTGPLYSFLKPYIEADYRKPYSSDDVVYNIQATHDFIVKRRQSVDDWLSCEVDGICPPCLEVENGGHRYQLCDYPRTFAESRAYCQKQGMDMLILNNDGESVYAQAAMASNFAITDFWLGLTDEASEGTFVWVDGSPLTYSSWSWGEPNDAGGEDCAQIFAGGQWNDLPCSLSLPAVCEAPCISGTDDDGDGFDACDTDCDDSDPNIHPGVDDVCGDGIDQDCNGYPDDGAACTECVPVVQDSHTYLFCSRLRTFDEARTHCQKLGADLVTVHDADQWNTLWSLSLSMLGENQSWLGLSDAVEEYYFVWVDGSPADYVNWSYYQPDNAGNEDCVGTFGDGTWNDFPCSYQLTAMCELKCADGHDRDQDGVQDCAGDCNDSDPTTYPGASEVCTDTVDHNCDGKLGAGCPAGCQTFRTDIGNGTFFNGAFCAESRAWIDAQSVCATFGGSLAWFQSQAEQEQVVMSSLSVAGGFYETWIGLNDRVAEGDYRWSDGSVPAYTAWASGQPNNGGGASEQDCTRMLPDFTWNDTVCDGLYPFFCRW